ncbi:hypothetical protein ACET3Z_030111 [Daucus carota]
MASVAASSSLAMKLLLVLVSLVFIVHMVQLTSHETSFSPSLAAKFTARRGLDDCEERSSVCGSRSRRSRHGKK